MTDHEPISFVRRLSAKLATKSRHVSLFFGAGTSRACGLPDIEQLKTRVLARLDTTKSAQFTAQLEGRSFEEALGRIRRVRALLSEEQQFDGLTAKSSMELDASVCKAVVQELDISGANLVPVRQLALWVRRASYVLPIEIFTVNYDLLLETAFDRHSVLYFDGFSGNLRARFQTELVEANPGASIEAMPSYFARIWKLHGSVNWVWGEGGQVFRLGQAAGDEEPAAIHPSDTKYEESRRYPFLVLQDRFRRSLNLPESLTLVSGYSFGDQHLNEMFYDAASRRERSEIIVFCHGGIPAELAEHASMRPNLQVIGQAEAIIGGVRNDWKASEDAPKEFWSDGKFTLPDFSALAAYLARTSAYSNDRDPVVRDLIEQLAKQSAVGAAE
jgi:hypothetical protein